MKLINILSGLIVSLIGVVFLYIDVSIIGAFWNISAWASKILNAPESLAVIITLFLIWTFFIFIVLIGLVGLYIICNGLIILFNN